MHIDIPEPEIYQEGSNVVLKIDFPKIYNMKLKWMIHFQKESTLIKSIERHIPKRMMTLSEIYLLHIK